MITTKKLKATNVLVLHGKYLEHIFFVNKIFILFIQSMISEAMYKKNKIILFLVYFRFSFNAVTINEIQKYTLYCVHKLFNTLSGIKKYEQMLVNRIHIMTHVCNSLFYLNIIYFIFYAQWVSKRNRLTANRGKKETTEKLNWCTAYSYTGKCFFIISHI